MKNNRSMSFRLLVLLGLVLSGVATADSPDSIASFAGGSGSGAASDTQVCTFNVRYHGTVMVVR